MILQQNEILFNHTHLKHLTGWWREYDFGSYGNVTHWMYVYFTLHIAQSIIYRMKNGVGEITLYGKVIANYRFNKKLKMPKFYNIHDDYSFGKYKQKIYLNGLSSELKNKFELSHV